MEGTGLGSAHGCVVHVGCLRKICMRISFLACIVDPKILVVSVSKI